ncbi:MAG TPA: hypothetical protein PKA90_00875 [Ignavibacteria bacterium]|nr:hypothetical protein [Ignavibacteria bacterium]
MDKSKVKFIKRFIFRYGENFMLNNKADFLISYELNLYNFFKDYKGKQNVLARIPSIVILFNDPVGNAFEDI